MNWDLLSDAAVAVFIYMNAMFILALRLKDNSIVDIGWGLGSSSSPVSDCCYTDRVRYSGSLLPWWYVGVRLASYIFIRNRGKGEDFRYAAWRKEWGSSVFWRSYLQVFMLQGMFMLVIASPLHVVFGTEGGQWAGTLGLVCCCGA
jgi:steroid 5-alpha reductase family enzyme